MRALIFLALLIGAPAWACEGLQVSDAWIREAPPGAHMLAGYARIANSAKSQRVIRSVASADFDVTEIHLSVVESGVSRMRHQEQLAVPAGGSVRLAPGGLHLMLMQPQRTLKPGDRVAVELGCGDHKPASYLFTVKSAP